MRGVSAVLILLSLLSLSYGSSTPTYGSPKQLAGPPSEFEIHALPNPSARPLTSMSAMITVDLAASLTDSNTFTWKAELPVDAAEVFVMTYGSPHADKTIITLTNSDGANIPLDTVASPGTFPVGESSVPVTNYQFSNLPIGKYTVQVTTTGTLDRSTQQKLSDEATDGYLLWFNYATTTIVASHLSSYNAEVGQDIGLVTYMIERTNVSRNILTDVVSSAVLVMDLPDGEVKDLTMHDDGLHSDGEPDDGVYGAAMLAQYSGQYSAQVVVQGVDASGKEFIRSTQHLISVASPFDLTGVALGTKSTTQKNRIDIQLGVVTKDVTVNYRPYAEVWGKSVTGDDVAICWISTLTQVDAHSMVTLELDMNWISLAKAQAPFTLKNVYVQDMSSAIPVATAAEIPIKMTKEVHSHLETFFPTTNIITDEMRQGVRPLELEVNSTGGGELLILHGYCSASNPWLPNAADFTNAQYFVNPDASISNDQYAKLVIAWAKPFQWRSLLGHSQGGCVSAHILNYYWSGADQASSGRLVQSVGSPYLGNSAAGSAASFGKVFGIGCGTNVDLSIEGATLWVAGITTTTRSKVNFYTTTYQQGNFWGDYCNLAINLILEFPNDGTAEFVFSVLLGAINDGNTEKWCHSTGMKYDAQYNDHSRNALMNRLAAR